MGNHIPQLGDRVRNLIDHANEIARAHNGLTQAHRALVVEVRALGALLLRIGHTHAADGSVVPLTAEDFDAAIKEIVAELHTEAAKAQAQHPAAEAPPAGVAAPDETAVN